jgi:5-deoxy-glucuronate isomerase
MLANTLYRSPRQPGLQLIQRRGEKGARELTTWRLYLDDGTEEHYFSPDEETVLVLQRGSGTLRVGNHEWRIGRKDVFTERASALYLPPAMELSVKADRLFEAVLFSTKCDVAQEPAVIQPDDVQVLNRGKDTYVREVHNIFVNDSHVQRLMVGETINAPGNWSSYPPHKHDGRNGEPKIEELYYYRVHPPQGFGHQMIYTNDGESVTHTVQDGDAVLIPYGYHPVAAAPGYKLYYLWAMAGEQRKLALYEDPGHSWVSQK